jgi:hypothetical protein
LLPQTRLLWLLLPFSVCPDKSRDNRANGGFDFE